MGHTLVFTFDEKSLCRLNDLLSLADLPLNKIPFGRDCDREVANKILPYHITAAHWAKNKDSFLLDKAKNFMLDKPFSVTVTGIKCMSAEENSTLLYFSLLRNAELNTAMHKVNNTFGECAASYPHITITAEKDLKKADAIYEKLKCIDYPFELTVSQIELYHIWRPIKRIK